MSEQCMDIDMALNISLISQCSWNSRNDSKYGWNTFSDRELFEFKLNLDLTTTNQPISRT